MCDCGARGEPACCAEARGQYAEAYPRESRTTGHASESYGQSNSGQALALADILAQNVYWQLKAEVDRTNTDIQLDRLMSITGGDFLGDQIKKRVEAAKKRATNALSRADGAFSKFDGAAGQVEKVAEQVEREADDLLAQIGQISNMPPDEPTGGPY